MLKGVLPSSSTSGLLDEVVDEHWARLEMSCTVTGDFGKIDRATWKELATILA
jgi:hypothetical protein